MSQVQLQQNCLHLLRLWMIVLGPVSRKAKKRKDYTFWHQFNDKPSVIPGCPGSSLNADCQRADKALLLAAALRLVLYSSNMGARLADVYYAMPPMSN